MNLRRWLRGGVWLNAFGVFCTAMALVFTGWHWWLTPALVVVLGVNVWLLQTNRKRLHFIANPVPPTDVKITTPDGTVHPVDCFYDGFNGQAHVWHIIPPSWLDYDYATTHRLEISVGELPPMTAIDITLKGEP